MKKNGEHRRHIAVFLIALVLTLPFYSANSFAALQITKNEGDAGVEGFLDAAGDTWRVEATVNTGQPVARNQVKINGYEFDSCAQSSVSGHVCSYRYQFGGLPEGEYPLSVEVFDSAGNKVEDAPGKITLDGSKPVLSNFNVVQEAGQVKVSFSALEKPAKCVGFAGADIIDKSNGNIVKSVPLSGCSADVNEIVTISSASGKRNVGVEVFDRLGHKAAASKEIDLDLVPPAILKDTFKVGSATDFVASGKVTETLSVEAEDDLAVLSAAITSTALGLDNAVGECGIVNKIDEKNRFLCSWDDVQVDLKGSFSVTITVSDGGGNRDVETISKTFSVDDDKPEVVSFGSETAFIGKQFAHTGRNTFAARFNEVGSGMAPEMVLADFSGVHAKYRGKKAAATECVLEDEWICRWKDIDVGHAGIIVLLSAEDRVGNKADVTDFTASLEIDDAAPVVDANRIFAVAVAGQSGEVRDIFQSRDKARVSFDVAEQNGVIVKADVSEVVDDGGIIDAVCSLKPEQDEIYECTFITERIRSGHIAAADIVLLVSDTAGNEIEVRFPIEIFAVENEADPAFWRQAGVTCSPDGVDVSVLKLGAQRVFCSVQFSSKARDVEIVSTQVVGCEEAEDTVQVAAPQPGAAQEEAADTGSSTSPLEPDVFMVNNFRGSKVPQIVFEFQPVDGVGLGEKKFECELGIVTRRGNAVIQNSEIEEVEVTIPFYQTKFDNEISTIEDRIDDARDDAEGAWEIVGVLNDVFTWIKILCNILGIVLTIIDTFTLIEASSDTLRHTGFPPTIAVAVGMCVSASEAKTTTAEGLQHLYVICALATCGGTTQAGIETFDFGATPYLGVYLKYQQTVLNAYNSYWGGLSGAIAGPIYGFKDDDPGKLFGGGDFLGLAAISQAKSPYDNMILSVATLCLPGIIYNLEKYRQIQCRYVGCLENEVQAGVATVGACRELKDYQECKYFWGELFQLIPLIGFLDNLLNFVKNIISDPIGIIVLIIKQACSATCTTSGTVTGFCEGVAWGIHIINFVNRIISAYNQIITTTQGDYCSQVGL